MTMAVALRPDVRASGGVTLSMGTEPTGTQKAAIILQALVSQGGTVSLEKLDANLQQTLAEEFSAIKHVDQTVLDSVIAEFEASMATDGLRFPIDMTERMSGLTDVLETNLLTTLRETLGLAADDDIWREVGALSSEKLAETLAMESPRIGALILSKLPPARASELLDELPEESTTLLAQMMAKTEEASPMLVESIGVSLLGASRVTTQNGLSGDSVGRLAAILDAAKPASRDHILAVLAEDDPEFAKLVRAAIFTFGDIPARLTVEDVPKITREVPPEDLNLALGYAKENAMDTFNHITNNMSKRMADALKDEIEEAGEISQDVGEAAQSRVAGIIRAMQDRGEITLTQHIDPEEAV